MWTDDKIQSVYEKNIKEISIDANGREIEKPLDLMNIEKYTKVQRMGLCLVMLFQYQVRVCGEPCLGILLLIPMLKL